MERFDSVQAYCNSASSGASCNSHGQVEITNPDDDQCSGCQCLAQRAVTVEPPRPSAVGFIPPAVSVPPSAMSVPPPAVTTSSVPTLHCENVTLANSGNPKLPAATKNETIQNWCSSARVKTVCHGTQIQILGNDIENVCTELCKCRK